jgi:hypothetical protein
MTSMEYQAGKLKRKTLASLLVEGRGSAYDPARRKLSAVGKGLVAIGRVNSSTAATSTEALHLSCNRLSTLDGVQQFPRLRRLGAGDNNLATFNSLAALSTLRLEAASFEGNPVARLPNYLADRWI